MLVAPAVMDDRSPTSSTPKPPAAPSPSQSTTPADINKPGPTTARPLYSSKLSDQLKSRVPASTPDNASSSSTTSNNRRPTPPQRAWTGAKNPITGRSQTPQAAPNPQDKQSVTGALREGQRVRLILNNGAEYEGTYANNPANPDSCYLKMVQQKKGQDATEIRNGAGTEANMSFQRSQIADARPLANNNGRPNDKAYNGNTPQQTGHKFRTDTAISSTAGYQERKLQKWVPEPDSTFDGDGSLEAASSGRGEGQWDQFRVAELRGLKSDYDENIYTTAINRDDPNYYKRRALADRKAREIETSAPMTSHVAEERQADYKQGTVDEGGDEEEKYSGVRRQDFPPLQNRENKYTPPARRAPTGHSTVKGAPVDPAIISSQLKAPPSQKQGQGTPKTEENKVPPAPVKVVDAKPDAKPEAKSEAKAETKVSETKATPATGDGTAEKNGTTPRPPTTTGRAISSQTGQVSGTASATASKPSATTPSTSDTVQQEVAKEFKKFAILQRANVETHRSIRIKADKEVKLTELRKFSLDFKLATPVPKDIVSIIAKDPQKQKEIQEKALRDAEEVKAKAKKDAEDAKAKSGQKEKEGSTVAPKDKQAKAQTSAQPVSAATSATTTSTAAVAPADSRNNTVRPTAPQHSSSPSAVPGRHTGARQPYTPQSQYQHQPYRNNHQAQHMGGRTGPQTGNLAQRIREQQKLHPQQHAQHMSQHMPVDMRAPPTGPANNVDAPYGRRLSGLPPSHLQQAKLNPNTQEFRPSAFAPAFNPAGPSQGSSPRSNVNSVVDPPVVTPPSGGQLIRRKTKAVDPKKCDILGHLKTLKPKVPNKNWDDNGGLQPCFATNPTWRQIEDENKERERKPDSTMLITYQEYFEQLPRPAGPSATPNPQHTVPTTAHLHQLPFHLQNPNPNMPPGQSPRMPPMQMHTPQHGHVPHTPYNPNPDDHRMMHSNSAQSFASPRVTPQMQMAYAPNMSNMNSPAQMPYTQPVMQPYMTPGAPQMNPQFRSFSNNPQFMPPQAQHMGGPGQPPFMMQQPQHFMPSGMVPGPGQMPMYAGYMQAPGTGPPPSITGSNGYPSPGRPAAPMMAQQGSYHGQQMGYGMSPGVQYQQTFMPQQHQHQQQNKYPGQRNQ